MKIYPPSLRRSTRAVATAALLGTGALATLVGCRGAARPTGEAGSPDSTAGAAVSNEPRAPGGSAAARTVTPSLAITLAQAQISGRLPAGSDAAWVRVTLLGPDGQDRGSGEAVVDDPDAVWTIYLRDPADKDADVLIRPGDRLRVELGDGAGSGERTVVVPDLRLAFDREGGKLSGEVMLAPDAAALVTGTLEPAAASSNTPVDPRIAIAQPSQAPPVSESRSSTTALPSGTFSLSFDAGLPGGSALGLTAAWPDQALSVSTARRVPYVRASLHPGDITGAARPDSEIALELRDAEGALRASGRATSDAEGRFSGWAILPDGRRARPAPGDRVVVRDPEGEIAIAIPPFAAEADVPANRISGTAAPGAPIDIVLWNPWYPGEAGNPRTQAAADGSWSVEPPVAVHPASHYYVTVHLPRGDLLYYCYQIPMLQVEPGSPAVEIQTLWEAKAALALIRDGRVIARAQGGGPWSGNLRLVLRAVEGGTAGVAAGTPVAVRAGDTVEADFGTGAPQRVEVLPLQVDELAEGAEQITGRAAPGAKVGLARTEAPITSTFVTAGPDGSFALDARPLTESADRAYGPESFEVFSPTRSGHNLHHRFVGPTLTVDLGGHAALGRAQPGARVSVIHRSADGATLAAADTVADPTGDFTATFGADTPALGAGDTVGLRIGEADRPEMRLELQPITAELDPGGALLRGTGPADGLLDIAVYVGESEAPDRLSSFIGEDGAWSVDLRNPVTGLSAPDLGLIRRIELVHRDEKTGFAERLVVGP